MIALLQIIIRRPSLVSLLLLLISSWRSSITSELFCSSNGSNFSFTAYALSTTRQTTHHSFRSHHNVAFSAKTCSGSHRITSAQRQEHVELSITRLQHYHKLYTRNYSSRLLASNNNIHDESDCISSEDMLSQLSSAATQQQLTSSTIPSKEISSIQQIDRRTAILQLLSISLISTTLTSTSYASEIDTSTGELFSPRNEMIKGGGTRLGRGGIRLKEKQSQKRSNLLKSSGLIQSVYETRFVTYLTRFLLVYDPAAKAWWKKNLGASSSTSSQTATTEDNISNFNAGEQFAQFAESVEIGLADYFLGPYGSYASVEAAKAGLGAVETARSLSGGSDGGGSGSSDGGGGFWGALFNSGGSSSNKSTSSSSKKKKNNKGGAEAEQTATKQNRQGILNLFTLLSARYTSIEEKQQLAILFSLISNPELQPVQEIRGLLGEIDNGTIAEVQLGDTILEDDDDTSSRDYFRLSSRQGGGFASYDTPIVSIDPPAPLGDDYKPAKIEAIMKPTSRILRINVIDGGEGYVVAPDVIVKQNGVSRQCEAAAIIDRKGRVSEVIVLNPGYGYGGIGSRSSLGQGKQLTLPTVKFRERKFTRQKQNKKNASRNVKPAKAVVELEYKVAGVKILDGGTGYSFDSPPEVKLTLPATDPDWFVAPNVSGQSLDEDEDQYIAARVTKMKSGRSGAILDTDAVMKSGIGQRVTRDILRTVLRDPIALLPSSIRPELSESTLGGVPMYSVKSLPRPPSEDVILPSSYRSIDPLFGGIGRAPVTKNAVTLSASQYSRLALSGAICTVLVRTALNPLELVKTKIQLGNDEEIIEYAMEKAETKSESSSESKEDTKGKTALGTTQVIQSLVEVRGPLSLFQSADVTFLASVVFGLFGFGATELFRRSFSAVFFNEASAAANSPNEFVLLAAAGVATLLTCAAASPFELLRVRSMAQIENEGVREVFNSFVDQNRLKRGIKATTTSSTSAASVSGATSLAQTTGLQIDDIKPFWSSFYPIVSRELPFAVTKFLVFDLAAGTIADFINSSNLMGSDAKIQVGVGTAGLLLSAFSGALAGIAGAFVSHPADLILTLTSAASREGGEEKDWKIIVKELLTSDGGVLNLYAGFPARAVFFFLVIGAQFFLYDYLKTIFEVGTDDLTLVLDVFYAIRQGL